MPLLRVWLDTITAGVLACIRQGMIASDAVEKWAIDEFSHRVDPHDLAAVLPAILASSAEMFAAEQRSWSAITDCDRLDSAFDDLNARGIVARHYVGHRLDFYDEYHRLGGMQNGARIRGFALYDHEATAEAAKGAPLAIYAASSDDNDPADVAIMNEVVEILRSHGLVVSWDGTLTSCLFVNLEWKRRKPPERWIGI